MKNETRHEKLELRWSEKNRVWRDWLGNVWYNDTVATKARDVAREKIFNSAFQNQPTFFGMDMSGSKWFAYKPKEDNGSYVFRGEIDLEHAVHDCIRDNRLGFIAIGPDFTHIGVLSGILDAYSPKFLNANWITIIDGYMTYKIDKASTPHAVKWLPGAVAAYRKKIKKLARKIRKKRGKLSKSPETKVMTY